LPKANVGGAAMRLSGTAKNAETTNFRITDLATEQMAVLRPLDPKNTR